MAQTLERPLENPFLQGPFAPVKGETTLEQLTVSGQLPPELDGLYVRIGPNPIRASNKPGRYHWFTGDGMVHGLRLSQGRAQWYRNRWVGTDQAQEKLGRAKVPGDTRSVVKVVNTNVFGHAGKIWATVEAGPVPVQLDGQLASVKQTLFGHRPTLPFTAHPHRDPDTGDLHAICYDALQHRKVWYVRVNAQGVLDHSVAIPVKHGPMIHDCAITRSQVVVLDLPVTFSWKALLARDAFPYRWNPKHAARVGLLPRQGQAGDVRWFDLDPCFVFHPCNAFDQPDGSVVMDVAVHRSMFAHSRSGPEADTQPRFERWTLPAGGTRVQREVICERPQEFPRLDERLTGRPYRFAYTAEFDVGTGGGQKLLKHDLHARTTTTHDFGPGRKPGEFVFVPRHADAAEDEGWLMGYVANLDTGCGEFHLLDARHVGAPAVAVVALPVPVPMGFHGNWVAAADLSAPPDRS